MNGTTIERSGRRNLSLIQHLRLNLKRAGQQRFKRNLKLTVWSTGTCSPGFPGSDGRIALLRLSKTADADSLLVSVTFLEATVDIPRH